MLVFPWVTYCVVQVLASVNGVLSSTSAMMKKEILAWDGEERPISKYAFYLYVSVIASSLSCHKRWVFCSRFCVMTTTDHFLV